MKFFVKTAFVTVLTACSVSAFAASHLTPQQCNDYPFTPVKGEVTHAQLEQQLAELEAVGYNPSEDEDYPRNLDAAKAKLQSEYRADCQPPSMERAQSAPST